jgi:hypothetical protein
MKTKVNTTSPRVEFEYPDSESGLLKIRHVRVTNLDSSYLAGFELPNPHATVELGKFKKFKLSKITRDGIVLRAFSPT